MEIAVLTHETDQREEEIVRCFTIADRQNSFGSRFSEEERQWVENDLHRQGIRKRQISWQEYKTYVWAENHGEDEGEEAVKCIQFTEEQAFTGNSASQCNGFDKITSTDRPQDYLLELFRELASNNVGDVSDAIDDILQYIISVHNRYEQVLNFNGRESDYHGFLSGFLMNFR